MDSAKRAIVAAPMLTVVLLAAGGWFETAADSPTSRLTSGVRHVALKPASDEAAAAPAQGGAGETADASTGAGIRTANNDLAEASAAEGEYAHKPKVDPILANGPIFVDWPKPQLAIVFTGELDGYLEPCGCAGLENQLGGLKRRHTFIKQMRDNGWPLVLLDVGGLIKRGGSQSEIKYRYALESLGEIGYHAVGLGATDLKVTADALAYALGNVESGKNPIVSANVGVYGLEESLSLGFRRPYVVIEAGGKRIGVTSVLGARHREAYKNLSPEEIAIADPVEALNQVAPKLAAERCDLQVLLVHGDPAEADELARQFPQFQVVQAAGGAEEPPRRFGKIDGSTAARIEAGHKGMYAIVLGVFEDPDPAKQTEYRYQRVPLDSRFADSSEMQAKLVAYQKELETTTLAGLGLNGVVNPDGEFVGSAACADCHTEAWKTFEKTPHYHATDTLEKLDPPRHFDPECLSCHVTGWQPQEYFPYVSGYMGLEQTPDLTQNGCENCHGPGADHVAAESGEAQVTEEERQALAAAMRMKVVENEGNKEGQVFGQVVKNCLQCHDTDNSPDFDFQVYWPKVKHEGID